MDQKDIELEVRLMAIEHLLTKLYAVHYASKGYSIELVASMHKLQLEQARQETFPGAEAAMSDHAAGEFETALSRLQAVILETLAAVKAQ